MFSDSNSSDLTPRGKDFYRRHGVRVLEQNPLILPSDALSILHGLLSPCCKCMPDKLSLRSTSPSLYPYSASCLALPRREADLDTSMIRSRFDNPVRVRNLSDSVVCVRQTQQRSSQFHSGLQRLDEAHFASPTVQAAVPQV